MVFTGVQSAELWTKSGSSYLLATSWSARCRSHIFEASHKRRHTSISDFCKTWPGAAKAKHSSLAAERDILSCNMQGAKNGCGWQTWRNEQGLANGNAEQVHPNLSMPGIEDKLARLTNVIHCIARASPRSHPSPTLPPPRGLPDFQVEPSPDRNAWPTSRHTIPQHGGDTCRAIWINPDFDQVCRPHSLPLR